MDSLRTGQSAAGTPRRPNGSVRTWLIAYFHSGWAFLIPYLGAYLLYAWLQWPVNPAAHSGTAGDRWSAIPPLLHVWWALHAVHLLLGALALRAWIADPADGATLRAGCRALSPWLGLALLFWVPGVYLEWPADPWSHFDRINLWRTMETVSAHPAWIKSAYFLGYSVIGGITDPAAQLPAYNLFYTGCCLLLCWQYLQLARGIGLGERASLIFVLVQALTMGNQLFGFYRYYGMSSSLFAQLGAVALIRLTLDATRPLPSGAPSPWSVLRLAGIITAAVLLSVFTAFNHVQGLGIAALGIISVLVWRMVAWQPKCAWWLGGLALVASVAAVLWLPRAPQIDAFLKPAGWLNSWYGLNLLWPGSPAFDRSLAIWGLFGLANLLAAGWLILRNHPAGWLTLLPVVLLSLPAVAIPFVNQLLAAGQDILVFHRMLLAIPAGLAVVALTSSWLAGGGSGRSYAVLLLALVALMAVPVGRPGYNRIFNVLSVVPEDLTGLEIPPPRAQPLPGTVSFQANRWPAPLIANDDVLFRLQAMGYPSIGRIQREVWLNPTSVQVEKLERLLADPEQNAILALADPTRLQTPLSQTAFLSGHWRAQQVAAGFAGSPELARAAILHGRTAQSWHHLTLYARAAYELSRDYGAYRDVMLEPAETGVPVSLTLKLDSQAELWVEVLGRAETGEVEPSLEPVSSSPGQGRIQPISRAPWVWAVQGHGQVRVKFLSPAPFSWHLQSVRVLVPNQTGTAAGRSPAMP